MFPLDSRTRPAVIALGIAALSFCSLSTALAQATIADSAAEFSGVQGQDDWMHGIRNVTIDGGGIDYDPVNDFLPFPTDGTTTPSSGNFWNGTIFDWANDGGAVNPPWTNLGAQGTHPNGTNQAEEHWTIRRWTAPASDLSGPSLLKIDWFVAKNNANGNGVTALLYLNGVLQKAQPIAGNITAGVSNSTFLTVDVGDHVDLALNSFGPDGSGHDGNDSSTTIMTISTVIDTDSDLLPDSWEEIYYPGNLTFLFSGGDDDLDGLNDEVEFQRGTDPTKFDTDGDGLEDGVETLDGNFVDQDQTGTDPTNPDTDGDGLSDFDEVFGTPPSNPNLVDTDSDGFNDSEELFYGSDPGNLNDTPLSAALADSRTQFSGEQGRDGWFWGYRDASADGKGTDYDPATDFLPFPVDGTTTPSDTNYWNGNNYDWFNGNPPWTVLERENTHPNGANNGAEHWTVRRWVASGLAGSTPVRVIHHTRAANLAGGNGTTGSIHLNGIEMDTRAVGGTDGTGFIRFYYLHIDNGDIIDQVLTPVGPGGDRGDGADGSANWMTIDTRIPEVPIQPDGKYFIPNDAEDSDSDGMADFWEREYFGPDLTQLARGQDWDGDGLNDEDEQSAGTDPTIGDTDNDGFSDGEEAALGTNPCDPDSDRDGFDDRHEVFTGYDPLDGSDNASINAIAHSLLDFPLSEADPQGLWGWTHGYYNITADGEPPSNTNFIEFPTDGSTIRGAGNWWDGNNFDFVQPDGTTTNPPWTWLARAEAHPNGSNNGDIHWVVRRWEVQADGPLALNYHVRKQNANGGGGTTAILLHNGQQIDSLTVGGTDNTGITSWFYVNAKAGDQVAVALSPRGTDGTDQDGNDGSVLWLLVDPTIPADPKQPDGTSFAIGAGPTGPVVTSIDYDQDAGDLTLVWTSLASKEYQIEELTATDPVTWTPIGPTVIGQAGTTQWTLDGISGTPRLFHVREVNP